MAATDRACESLHAVADAKGPENPPCAVSPPSSEVIPLRGHRILSLGVGSFWAALPPTEAYTADRRELDTLSWYRQGDSMEGNRHLAYLNLSDLEFAYPSLPRELGLVVLVHKADKPTFGFPGVHAVPSLHLVPPYVWPVRRSSAPPSFYFLCLDSLTRMAARRLMPRTMELFGKDHSEHLPLLFKAFHSIVPSTAGALLPFLYGGFDARPDCLFRKSYISNQEELVSHFTKCLDPKRHLLRELRGAGYKTGLTSTFVAASSIPFIYFKREDLDYVFPFVPCPGWQHGPACGELRCFHNGRYGEQILHNNLALLSPTASNPPVALWSHFQGAHATQASLQHIDDMLTEHLKILLKTAGSAPQGRLANTIIVLLGDHGCHSDLPCGRHRPFLGIFAPRSLGGRIDELRSNIGRLVTMWDLRATVRHFARLSKVDHFDLAGLRKRSRHIYPQIFTSGYISTTPLAVDRMEPTSLASAIPVVRTCAQAGIPGLHCSVGFDPSMTALRLCAEPGQLSAVSRRDFLPLHNRTPVRSGQKIDVEWACQQASRRARQVIDRNNERLAIFAGKCNLLTLKLVEFVMVDWLMHFRFMANEGTPPRLFDVTIIPDAELGETLLHKQVTRWESYTACMPKGADPEWCVCGESSPQQKKNA